MHSPALPAKPGKTSERAQYIMAHAPSFQAGVLAVYRMRSAIEADKNLRAHIARTTAYHTAA